MTTEKEFIERREKDSQRRIKKWSRKGEGVGLTTNERSTTCDYGPTFNGNTRRPSQEGSVDTGERS